MEIPNKVAKTELIVKGKPLSEEETLSRLPSTKLTGAPFEWSIEYVSEGVVRAINGKQIFEGTMAEFNRRLK